MFTILSMKSGVWLHHNCLGVLPLSVALPLGDLGLAALLAASNPKFLGRSSIQRYVDELGVLLEQ